jgi:hypothetical protein
MIAATATGDFRPSLANLCRPTAAAYELIANKSRSDNDAQMKPPYRAGQAPALSINQWPDTGTNRSAAAGGSGRRWSTEIASSISTT